VSLCIFRIVNIYDKDGIFRNASDTVCKVHKQGFKLRIENVCLVLSVHEQLKRSVLCTPLTFINYVRIPKILVKKMNVFIFFLVFRKLFINQPSLSAGGTVDRSSDISSGITPILYRELPVLS